MKNLFKNVLTLFKGHKTTEKIEVINEEEREVRELKIVAVLAVLLLVSAIVMPTTNGTEISAPEVEEVTTVEMTTTEVTTITTTDATTTSSTTVVTTTNVTTEETTELVSEEVTDVNNANEYIPSSTVIVPETEYNPPVSEEPPVIETEPEVIETVYEEPSAESMTYLGNLKITGYVATGNPTASGCYPYVGGVAMSRSYGLPWGTTIYIEGLGYYTLFDCGCSYGVVDVFCNSISECYNLTSYANVYVVN